MANCRRCKHFYKDSESWEMPHIWWYACNEKPNYMNLKSFPFHNTKCDKFEESRRNDHLQH